MTNHDRWRRKEELRGLALLWCLRLQLVAVALLALGCDSRFDGDPDDGGMPAFSAYAFHTSAWEDADTTTIRVQCVPLYSGIGTFTIYSFPISVRMMAPIDTHIAPGDEVVLPKTFTALDTSSTTYRIITPDKPTYILLSAKMDSVICDCPLSAAAVRGIYTTMIVPLSSGPIR